MREETRTGRVGRVKPCVWTHGRLLLVLTAAVALPWLSAPDEPPYQSAMRWISGSPQVFVDFEFHPDGRTIATVGEQGQVWLHPLFDGLERSRQLAGIPQARDVAFSPNGRYLAIGLKSRDVILCDLAHGDACRPLGILIEEIRTLCFSPDSRTLAVCGFHSGKVALWDLDAERVQMTLGEKTSVVLAMTFSPDGRSLTTIHRNQRGVDLRDYSVRIWDLATGRARFRLNVPDHILTCDLTPDGRALALSHSRGQKVLLFKSASDKPFRQITGATSARSVAISTDARLLATSTGGSLVNLYNVATGEMIRRLDGACDSITRLRFSPDGTLLAAAGNDGDVRLWDLNELSAD